MILIATFRNTNMMQVINNMSGFKLTQNFITAEKNNHFNSTGFYFPQSVCLTSRPVGTCRASFTLAKFPFPMVFSSRYFPTCGVSSAADGEFLQRADRTERDDTWPRPSSTEAFWENKHRWTEFVSYILYWSTGRWEESIGEEVWSWFIFQIDQQ